MGDLLSFIFQISISEPHTWWTPRNCEVITKTGVRELRQVINASQGTQDFHLNLLRGENKDQLHQKSTYIPVSFLGTQQHIWPGRRCSAVYEILHQLLHLICSDRQATLQESIPGERSRGTGVVLLLLRDHLRHERRNLLITQARSACNCQDMLQWVN